MDSIFIHDSEFLTSSLRKFSNFSCWKFWKVFFDFKWLDLVGCVAAVEGVQERTLVSERHKLQLRQCLVLLVLVGYGRLLRILVHQLIIVDLFLELFLLLLRVWIAFVTLLLRSLVLLIWVLLIHLLAVCVHLLLQLGRSVVALMTTIAKTSWSLFLHT